MAQKIASRWWKRNTCFSRAAEWVHFNFLFFFCVCVVDVLHVCNSSFPNSPPETIPHLRLPTSLCFLFPLLPAFLNIGLIFDAEKLYAGSRAISVGHERCRL